MKNYTLLNKKLLEEITKFTKDFTEGLGKVDSHFLCDVIHGIISKNSIILSDIVRATGNENIKKGVERLERHLDKYNNIRDIVESNYISIVKPLINSRNLYFVDGGDITKKCKY